MLDYKIEICKINDAKDIFLLEKKSFNKPYSVVTIEDMLKNSAIIFLKAVKADNGLSGKLIGYASMQIILDEAEIHNIAVDLSLKRKGVGKSLALQLIAAAKEKGVKRIFLEVNENNTLALSLYSKLGFEIVSVRQKYYGEDSAKIMSLSL